MSIIDVIVTIILSVIGLSDVVSIADSILISFLEVSVSVRRLHDIGKSGSFILLNIIPVIGSIVLLVWALKDSQPGDNQYGPNPKGM